MKKYVIILFVVCSLPAFAQFKKPAFPQKTIKDGMISQNTSNMIFGFINPNNFEMHQSYSMSYSSFGSQGMALGVYTNRMMYKFNKNLNVQLDASFINSPYNTFGSNFTKSINGVYISRAAINWKPMKDVSVSLQYSNAPASLYSGYYGGYYGLNNGFMDEGPFSGR